MGLKENPKPFVTENFAITVANSQATTRKQLNITMPASSANDYYFAKWKEWIWNGIDESEQNSSENNG